MTRFFTKADQQKLDNLTEHITLLNQERVYQREREQLQGEQIRQINRTMEALSVKFDEIHVNRSEELYARLERMRVYLRKAIADWPVRDGTCSTERMGAVTALRELQAEFRKEFGVWKDQ